MKKREFLYFLKCTTFHLRLIRFLFEMWKKLGMIILSLYVQFTLNTIKENIEANSHKRNIFLSVSNNKNTIRYNKIMQIFLFSFYILLFLFSNFKLVKTSNVLYKTNIIQIYKKSICSKIIMY